MWRKEKEEATQAFNQERKKFEDQIETLQKQVMEQSMTMSMMSSVTPDDFNHGDDDLYGKFHNSLGRSREIIMSDCYIQ